MTDLGKAGRARKGLPASTQGRTCARLSAQVCSPAGTPLPPKQHTCAPAEENKPRRKDKSSVFLTFPTVLWPNIGYPQVSNLRPGAFLSARSKRHNFAA